MPTWLAQVERPLISYVSCHAWANGVGIWALSCAGWPSMLSARCPAGRTRPPTLCLHRVGAAPLAPAQELFALHWPRAQVGLDPGVGCRVAGPVRQQRGGPTWRGRSAAGAPAGMRQGPARSAERNQHHNRDATLACCCTMPATFIPARPTWRARRRRVGVMPPERIHAPQVASSVSRC